MESAVCSFIPGLNVHFPPKLDARHRPIPAVAIDVISANDRRMKHHSIRWTAWALIGLLVAQAILLRATGRFVLLTKALTPVYIYEGDIVGDQPPANADEASRTVKASWLDCRYWTGFSVRHIRLPRQVGCPTITG